MNIRINIFFKKISVHVEINYLLVLFIVSDNLKIFLTRNLFCLMEILNNINC